jgi:exodeoxyribonuclease VII large subunit
MTQSQSKHLTRLAAQVDLAQAQLRALSPENTLARGYAIVRNAQGQIIRQAEQTQVGQPISVTLGKGELEASVVSTRQE